jgi:hypothetical protein
MANHRKKLTRRQRSCGLCKPHKRQGNAAQAQTMQELRAREAERAA